MELCQDEQDFPTVPWFWNCRELWELWQELSKHTLPHLLYHFLSLKGKEVEELAFQQVFHFLLP